MYYDFYEHWDQYHAGSDNDTDCDWKYIEVTCADFSFAENDTCDVWLSYSPCNDTDFYCQVQEYENGTATNLTDCTSDFEDPEFWSMMSQEQFWQDNWEQYGDFYTYWEEYHADYNNTCEQECYDPYDCADEFGIEYCEANYCYDTCTYDSECWINYSSGDTYEMMECEAFYEMMSGNDTNDTDCEWVYVDLTCDNFTMIDGECWIYAEYNRCNDSYFYCVKSGYDENNTYVSDDCADDFEDSEFWSEMSEEQFWFDNWDMYYDFYEFW
jgi:hypothetical protein